VTSTGPSTGASGDRPGSTGSDVAERSAARGAGDVDLDPITAVYLDPERFLRRREGDLATRAKRFGKRLGERRALRRVLSACGPLETVLDCPCGMGRLFDSWTAQGMSVTGLDRSPAMVEAARDRLRALGREGHVIQGRVTDLDQADGQQFDLVASIRFLYYFDDGARPEVLRLLARRSRRWVLVQYKTSETWKGRRNRRQGRNQGKHPLSRAEIRSELAAAGLRLVAFEPHGPFSDRVLALAQLDELR
jgi:ubiquinone/menaquinone biosynthesis C-methylase UbiE